MITAEKFSGWLAIQTKNGASIKRPSLAVMNRVAREKKAKSGDAVKGILIIIIAPVIFCILSLMIL